MIEAPATIPGTWSGALLIAGRAPVAIRWCGAGVVVVDRMTVASGSGGLTEHAFDHATSRLAHGASIAREIAGSGTPGDVAIAVFAIDASGASIEARGSTRAELAPDFVAERDRCLADGGSFGPVGMARTFACDRPTHDAGRRCLSGADCEGPCLEDHTELTASPPDGRTCAPGEELHLHVGACASHSLLFGCAPRLDEARTECVAPGRPRGRRLVCVD